jgi:Phospholipase B
MKTQKSKKTKKKHTTRKRKNNGWKKVILKGSPYEIGLQHGTKLRSEIKKVRDILPLYIETVQNQSYESFMTKTRQIIKPIIQTKFPEIYRELQGIAEGSTVDIDIIIGWNAQMSVATCSSRCSAFIATGNSTKDGKIVMAHTTHSDFLSGQPFNIIFQIIPVEGEGFIMQSAPGLIWSMTDWFITQVGIIGCESTIDYENYEPTFGSPIFCRARQAMQFSKSIDDFIQILSTDNAGDYPCSWLLGDTNTNEIALFELGKTMHSIERTQSGFYYGMNSPHSSSLRQNETKFPNDYHDITSSSGSRNLRFQTLFEKYNGKIDSTTAKKIISDHYDESMEKENPGLRTICKHGELSKEYTRNGRPPYFPAGSTDGKIVTTDMANNMEFLAIWGPPCQRPFHSKSFMKKHPEYLYLKPYLEDWSNQRWTTIKF